MADFWPFQEGRASWAERKTLGKAVSTVNLRAAHTHKWQQGPASSQVSMDKNVWSQMVCQKRWFLEGHSVSSEGGFLSCQKSNWCVSDNCLFGTTRTKTACHGTTHLTDVVTMAWLFLIVAGVLETGWAVGLKAMSERPSITVVVATIASLIASMACLALAMRSLPLAIAYPVWTGIGSVGSVVLGFLVFSEGLQPRAIIGVVCVALGILLMASNAH
jgi:quaternary ammonium compound-resistance protein SugE